MHAQTVSHAVSTRAALTDIFEFKYLADYDTLIFDVPACTKERKTFTCVGCVFNFTFFLLNLLFQCQLCDNLLLY